ncbi:MAG: lysophospholipid acyltransferase family protein [Pseudomonadota bacterium]
MGTATPMKAAPRRRVRWHHRPAVRRMLASLIAGYIRLVDRTGHWELTAPPTTRSLIREGKPFVGAFWHGNLLMIYPAWRRLLAELGDTKPRQAYVISSSHGDGQLIQLAVNRFGMKTLWGSTRRGGVKVLREARRVLDDGDIVVMTPDGPRGPRMHAQPGIAYLAGHAKVPIVPITFAAKRRRNLNSWDRFTFVWPFTGGILAFDEPLLLPEDGNTESYRQQIEERMIKFSREIDQREGLTPIQPAA